jgi:hypothetical protein
LLCDKGRAHAEEDVEGDIWGQIWRKRMLREIFGVKYGGSVASWR